MIGRYGPPLFQILRGLEGAYNVALMKAAPKDENILFKEYLFYFLQTNHLYKHIVSNSERTAGQDGIKKELLEAYEIPLPPLEDQKRIAAILDKADAIRRKRKKAIALTEELLRATFLEMFGDPVTNPKGWKVKPMYEVVQHIEAGWSASGEERQCEENEWGVLKISAVTSGRFNSNEHKAVECPEFKKTPIVPQKGDLLFSRANTRDLVAATCLVESDCDRLFLPDKLWRINTDLKVANVEFLRFLLADPKYRSLIAKKATGTSGSMLNVSQSKLQEMYAPIPELSLQKRFAEVVWQAFELRERHELTSVETNSMFHSLLQKAFSGEL